ncbi:hypothetical protein K3U93_13065 [Mycobacterium malmoense]|uniref:GP55 protein n=1 Tax=Mycobacterium malmoense TaxID=1780 RepID=A0ABX3SRZ2_MYCMA|nr:hypothetical protein [Mycobacterium malmoense]ORA80926.1 hypothetical protein BST29_15655 [Mycobacterium malmoense]QZA15712.1 hypothetical protein K3U93_13065 [Mycobacterium malmoense]UNB92525.1 hypothetical protein H5T25_13055 [Mycobacterium malmoense]
MMSVLITVTLVAVGYSLWVRRHTWRSRWEAGASLNIALQGCAVLLMSPWASATLGPPLHHVFRRWNVEDLLGHICLIVAVTAIIHHGLARLDDERRLRGLFRRHIANPLALGVPLLVAVFIIADEGYHPDLFPAHVSTVWFGAYWLVLGALLVHLFTYAARVLLILRKDPRSTATANLYLISAAFGVAATVIQVSTAEAGVDITLPVWLCACLGAIGFAYGSARSWHAKVAWFTPGKGSSR